MAITTKQYRLRASSPIPKYSGVGCPIGVPSSYILQSFGVEVSDTDVSDAVTGLYASEVMQGLQNFEDTDEFRSRAYQKVSYTGSNNKDTDGNQIFRASEQHTSKWLSEEESGLNWIS